jgi:nickel superoxide dismutase
LGSKEFSVFSRLFKPSTVVHAHCDIPCGIYDPTAAKVAADTVAKMVEKISALQPSATDFTTRGNFVRMITVKEEHAQICKKELEILWSDYFKPEHVQKNPEITELCWKAAKQCSKVKGSLDLGEAKTLLDMIDKIADVWTKAGGPQATRVAKAAAAR